MLPRSTGWIASHMQRKLITITLTLCISVLVFICLVPLEKEFPVKNYHYQGKRLFCDLFPRDSKLIQKIAMPIRMRRIGHSLAGPPTISRMT